MKRGRFVATLLALLLVSLLVLPAGCGGEDELNEITLGNLVLQDSFALYYPVHAITDPKVSPYAVSPNLSNVAGAGQAALSPDAVGILAERGFLVTRGAGMEIYEVYQGAAGAVFVTVDALQHSLHTLSEYAQLEMESDFLLPDLEGLIGALYACVERMYNGSGGVVREAALKDMAYLGVAARLLALEVEIPSQVQEDVDRELALIAGGSGKAVSPLFGNEEDYGRFSPPGHYGTDPELERYYQAMTWLGMMGFCPDQGGSGRIAAGREMTRQAIILVAALHMSSVDGVQALAVWDRIYQADAFFAGVADDLDAYLYTQLIDEVFGKSFSLDRLGEDAAVDAFIARATEEGQSRGFEGEETICFRLFSERYEPDSKVFSRLVADEVPDRLIPRGLDLAAALGSDRALQVLDGTYGEYSLPGYAEGVGALREEFADVDPSLTRSSLYWGWLDAIAVLLEPCGDGYPAFMRGTAWQDRDLYAFLGAWTELRHDNASYEETSASGHGVAAGAVKGYVEPRPEVFAGLAASADMMRRGLRERSLARPAVQERLDALYELLIAMKTMAEKELRNEPLSEEEYGIIAAMGESLEYLNVIPLEGEGEEGAAAEPWMEIVSDVYTDPYYGEVLQVAVGEPTIYYVIAPVEGVPTLTMGAGLSYYEFVEPVGDRLSDESWRGMLEAGQAPAPPAWTDTFLR